MTVTFRGAAEQAALAFLTRSTWQRSLWDAAGPESADKALMVAPFLSAPFLDDCEKDSRTDAG